MGSGVKSPASEAIRFGSSLGMCLILVNYDLKLLSKFTRLSPKLPDHTCFCLEIFTTLVLPCFWTSPGISLSLSSDHICFLSAAIGTETWQALHNYTNSLIKAVLGWDLLQRCNLSHLWCEITVLISLLYLFYLFLSFSRPYRLLPSKACWL